MLLDDPILGMFLSIVFLFSKFNKDHDELLLLTILLDLVLFKRYTYLNGQG